MLVLFSKVQTREFTPLKLREIIAMVYEIMEGMVDGQRVNIFVLPSWSRETEHARLSRFKSARFPCFFRAIMQMFILLLIWDLF